MRNASFQPAIEIDQNEGKMPSIPIDFSHIETLKKKSHVKNNVREQNYRSQTLIPLNCEKDKMRSF